MNLNRSVFFLLLWVFTFTIAGTGQAGSISFDFDGSANVEFDASTVEVSSGVVRLRELTDQVDDANDAAGFGGGTHDGTRWNDDDDDVEIDLEAGRRQLPNGAVSNSWTDMQGNHLLLHLNADDEGGAFADFSGNGHSVTCPESQCPDTSASGQIRGGAQFDGSNDFLDVILEGVINPDTTNFTFESWIKFTTLDNGEHQALVSQDDGSGTGAVWLYLDDETDTLVSFLGATRVDSGFTPNVGEWYHVALTSIVEDGEATIRIFINGQERAREDGVNVAAATGNLMIGTNKSENNQWLFGGLDELAIYNRALSPDEILEHVSNTIGIFTSRIFNALAPNAPWQSLSWSLHQPSGVQLPDNSVVEDDYLARNADMTGNLALYHFNEAAAATSFADSSGHEASLSCSDEACPEAGVAGRFATALRFDGVNDRLSSQASLSEPVTGNFSAEFWVKFDNLATGHDQIIISQGDGTGTPARVWFGFDEATGNYIANPGSGEIDLETEPVSGWQHIAITKDETNLTFYLNGAQIHQISSTGITSAVGPYFIGSDDTGASSYAGRLDEIAFYERALTADEIANHYFRGATQLRFQVRSCDDAECSGESFAGPENEASQFYTDSDADDGLSAALSGVANNRYFQYQAQLLSSSTELTPHLARVEVSPRRYPIEINKIVIINKVAISFTQFISIDVQTGSGTVGVPRFQLSLDKQTWFFVQNGTWIVASSIDDCNTIEEINLNASTFVQQVGSGSLYFRAVLNTSEGTQPAEVDSITVNVITDVDGDGIDDTDDSDTDDGTDNDVDDGNDPTPDPGQNPDDNTDGTDNDIDDDGPSGSVSGSTDGDCDCNLSATPSTMANVGSMLMLTMASAPVLALRLKRRKNE